MEIGTKEIEIKPVKPEILAPAGSLEKLRIAVMYGADAVYLGGKEFSLRAGAENFTLEEIAQGVAFAHARGAKVYAAVNIFARNTDLERLSAYLQALSEAGVDALLVTDPGVISLAREAVPHLPLHLSTQANSLNWASARFWAEQGIKRIVLARELSLPEIREIREKVTAELEVFVHGAMCLAYSGRCFLSYYLTGRDANRGECTHPCRWQYALVESKRPGVYLPVEEDGRGSYILSSKDLCLLPRLPDLVRAGVNSFKIEGRMKSLHYVATVVRVYRLALDSFWEDPENYSLDPSWWEELQKVSHRPYLTDLPSPHMLLQEAIETLSPATGYRRTCAFAGLVLDYQPAKGMALVEQRSPFGVGDVIEILGPQASPWQQKVGALYDESGMPILSAPHPQQRVWLPVQRRVESGFLVRRIKQSED